MSSSFGFAAGPVADGCVVPSYGALDETHIEFKPQSGNTGTTHPVALQKPLEPSIVLKNWMALEEIPRSLLFEG